LSVSKDIRKSTVTLLVPSSVREKCSSFEYFFLIFNFFNFLLKPEIQAPVFQLVVSFLLFLLFTLFNGIFYFVGSFQGRAVE